MNLNLSIKTAEIGQSFLFAKVKKSPQMEIYPYNGKWVDVRHVAMVSSCAFKKGVEITCIKY